MGIFAGFDCISYPGDSKMKSLKDNTDLSWCGFYLHQHAPYDWWPHFETIKQMKWGVAPIYGGKQPGGSKLRAVKNPYLGNPKRLHEELYKNGQADGKEAVTWALKAKIPRHTIIYFDVENTINDLAWLTYYRGWSRFVVDSYFSIGLYTRAEHATWVKSRLMAQEGFDICIPTVWIAQYSRANPNGAPIPDGDYLQTPFPKPSPAAVAGGAQVWQHLGNFGMKWTDTSSSKGPQHLRHAPVDFDTSIFPDPGLGILSIGTA
jgi:hypothetical protein